ncbi:ANTAR domain-containing protein [Rhodococcus sp. RS1C4]|uniref:ANTAR domain-containing protein n=1 Tax=Nocardiaceae TaxID=85025 RepID=UPI0003811917|nr:MULTISPECIES: ANTAR domain-containing protein [Rhodococcus]OZC53381.1 ANTAR domain-containing protein [Rhodococcus sp. RS1C4]OZC58733.1 ANTAR domain-containing protein [Rhodococcus sp. 06-621-2]OZD11238.1 ANTAR domain-containing protein [Rhodococcus sp. 06-156-3C]OZD13468.1 ANTAR domain-containing protein [Rhodococcus sp. 06-156-4a]OZD22189.1 ANTAR domain-containing protein [Rhodococcus sp. 06-156-4C]
MKETPRVCDPRDGELRADEDGALEPGLESFRNLLLSHAQVETLLHSVCTQVVDTVLGADMAGVTLVDESTGTPKTVAYTDPRVLEFDAPGCLSAPISVDTTQIGALEVYSFTDHTFTETDEILIKVFVTAVESAIWNSRRASEAQRELTGLREAMRTRATIEQAKGIVMAIRGIAADDAFEVLSLQSQNENVKLHTLAHRIVESVGRDQS